jgi:hypothetical protein
LSFAAISANLPVSRLATVENPPKNANEDPRNAGTLNFEHTWKSNVPKPAQKSVTDTVRPLVNGSPHASAKYPDRPRNTRQQAAQAETQQQEQKKGAKQAV